MIEKEFAVEFLFKEKMMLKAIPELKKYLIKSSKLKEQNRNSFREYSLKKGIEVLKKIQATKSFDYYDAFIFCVVFSQEYLNVKELIQTEKMDLNKNFKREDYWRNEEIDFNEGLYFVYTFFNETYKTVLSLDFKKISEKFTDSPKKNSIIFMKKIDKIAKIENRK